jgi:alanyl-tRNA synthetase
MTANQIRQAYLDFFKKQGHAVIPAAPIVPLNDPTTLFTPFGMQQLVPYLKGEPHPMGTRLVDSQPCIRTEDIDEVGDNRHTTFFEMLGNWSLGDYFKQDQLAWIYNFTTTVVGLNPDNLYVSVFEGSPAAPKDDESIKIWQSLFKSQAPAQPGVDRFDPTVKIYTYKASKNWWSRAGIPENMPAGEIGGPDSEMFYDFGPARQLHENSPFKDQPCHLNCDCGRFMEIGNSVFMQSVKQEDGSFKPLPAQNVDFGGGLERFAAAANNDPDVFLTDLFQPIIQTVETITGANYTNPDHQTAMRIVVDHLRGSVFLIDGGVEPANKLQGYFLRRLLRRVALKLQLFTPKNLTQSDYQQLVDSVMTTYQPAYFNNQSNSRAIAQTIAAESDRFNTALQKGLRLIKKTDASQIDGTFAFNLYQSYGFPLELTQEILQDQGLQLDKKTFAAEFKKHQDKSRTASKGLFKGGLAGTSDAIVKFHTATHLLHQALRDVLGDTISQMGSNITTDRLRFDFKHPAKLTTGQLQQIATIVNDKISQDLPVHKTVTTKDEALHSGALAFFREKYPDTVSVYTIGRDPESDWYSKELCGGPHVTSTGQIGTVRIKKEESVGTGIRRIYIVHASG